MRLEDLSIGRRIALTFFIVLVILFALALFGYLSGRWEEAEAQGAPVVPSKYDDQIDELERQALGEAFKKHLGQLYSVWVTDNYQPRFPPKAVVGMRNNRDAYIRAMEAIDKRTETPRAR
jgi:hypothetical protein